MLFVCIELHAESNQEYYSEQTQVPYIRELMLKFSFSRFARNYFVRHLLVTVT